MNKAAFRISLRACFFILGVIFIQCSGDGPTQSNPHAPYAPEAIFPADQTIGAPTALTLQWKGGDPDNDPVTYHLIVKTSAGSMVVDKTVDGVNYKLSAIPKSTNFTWQLIAFDSTGLSTASPIWHFATSSEIVFPLIQGASWTYSGFERFDNPRPESLAYRVPIPTHFTSTVTVGPVDNSYGTVFPLAVQETAVETTYYGIVVPHQTNMLQNFQDGLYNFGWSGTFKNTASPRPSVHDLSVSIPGMALKSLDEWDYFRTGALASGFRPGPSDGPPIAAADSSSGYLNLRYPLFVGQEWHYQHPALCGGITKRVVARLQVTVPAGTFDCYKIDYLYLNPDGTLWSTFTQSDYVAAEGLIKREYYSPNAMISKNGYTVIVALSGGVTLKSLSNPLK